MRQPPSERKTRREEGKRDEEEREILGVTRKNRAILTVEIQWLESASA